MITSIFSKSKPINFIISFFVVALACTVSFFENSNHPVSFVSVLKAILLFAISYFGVLILNFISSKNSLTNTRYFEPVLYASFLLIFPQTTANLYLILANIFLLFGLRRIISLRSQRNTKKKLFDAGFWLAAAMLCYPWAALFLCLLVVAILLYTDRNIRNWLIPFVAVLCVLVMVYSIDILLNLNLLMRIIDGWSVSLNFTEYNTIGFLVGLTLLLSFGLWSSLFYVKNIKQKKRALRPSYYLIIWAVVLAFAVLVIVPQKNGGELLFMFAPLAIIIANYIEVIREKWFKELFFATLMVVPLVLLFL